MCSLYRYGSATMLVRGEGLDAPALGVCRCRSEQSPWACAMRDAIKSRLTLGFSIHRQIACECWMQMSEAKRQHFLKCFKILSLT